MNKPGNETLEVFGKILYALAMADGSVQKEEIDELHQIVEHNKWAKQIEFSFSMAQNLEMEPKMIFLKNMRVFRTCPINEHYPFFLDLMEKVANAHNGIVPKERNLIENFKSYFTTTGLKDQPHYYSVNTNSMQGAST